MVFCRHCGNKIPAGSLFCGKCGVRVLYGSDEIETLRGDTPTSEMDLKNGEYPQRPKVRVGEEAVFKTVVDEMMNPVVRAGSSRSFLWLVLFYIAALVFGIAGGVFSDALALVRDNLPSVQSQFTSVLPNGINADDIIALLTGVDPLSLLVSNIPTILIAMSLVLFYAACRRGDVSRKTLSAVRIFLTIDQILLTLCALVFAIAAVALIIVGQVVPALIFVGIAAFVLFWPILYFANVIKTVKNIRKTVVDRKPRKMSGYVIFVNWVVGVLSMAWGVAGFVLWLRGGSLGEIKPILGASFLLASSIAMAIFLMMTARGMSRYNEKNGVL